MSVEPKVDFGFQILGRTLPVDHGYAIYAAISRILPRWHDMTGVGMALVRGRYIGQGLLDISPRSELVLRVPASLISEVLPLSGKSLDVAGHTVRVGVPFTRALVPAATLYAHLVTTRNGHDQARFEAEIRRQADALGVKGKLTIGVRKTFAVHRKQVVGYSVLASELTAEESIQLQESGLGGRRKMGCGVFEVWKG